jgi:DNA-binding GntR family transcriptional regulator
MRDKMGSLADQIYGRLRDSIMRGQLQPGQRLIELDIAAQMGTSQGPVREALQRLERDGLVERRARSATFVTHISASEMVELFSVRSVIEGFATRHVASVITPKQCDILRGLIEAMRQAALIDDIGTLVEHDMEFHRHLCEWSGRKTLLQAWTPLYSQIQRFVVLTHQRYFPHLVEIADSHQPIVEALCSGNLEKSASVVQEHIMLVWSRMDQQLSVEG